VLTRAEIEQLVVDVGDYLASDGEVGMLPSDEEEKLRSQAIAMLFDEGEDSVDLDTFKRRSMRNKIVLNCYSIFDVAFGPLLSRMQKLTGSQKVFGVLLKSLKMVHSPPVPEVVHKTVEHIRNTPGGMDTQGIFRVSGPVDEFMALKGMFDRGEHVDLNKLTATPLNCARLLKAFVRELPEPLLTFTLYESFVEVGSLSDSAEITTRIKELIRLIPNEHFDLLKYLCTFLVELATHADRSKMTLENLATLFAPCLLRARESDPTRLIMDVHPCIQVTQALISHHTEIFVEGSTETAAERIGTSLVTENMKLRRKMLEMKYVHQAEVSRLQQLLHEKQLELEEYQAKVKKHPKHTKAS